MVSFEQILDGVARYLNKYLFSKMNDWQEVLARLAVGRVMENENLKQSLMANPFVRTFAIFDSEGNVELEPLMRDLRKEIEKKGKMTVDIPLFGKISFTGEDVTELYREITGGVL
ncbi:MAG: hypothetical protein IIW81_05265 [Oscillospiraceae bacterium]|nr:hypothetical protein [Oscillospiraceae bacterium]